MGLCLVASTGCGAAGQSGAADPSARGESGSDPPAEERAGIADVGDGCPLLIDCFDAFVDYDGCPEVALSFAKGSAALPAQSDPLLTDLVAEMQGIEHLRLLRIVGNSVEGEPEALGKERAVAVRNWLTAHGIAESMVEAVGDQGGSDALVVFEPVGC